MNAPMDIDANTCPVCISGVTPAGSFLAECGHVFHVPCIEQWVVETISQGSTPTCPTCRATLNNAPGMIAMQRRQRGGLQRSGTLPQQHFPLFFGSTPQPTVAFVPLQDVAPTHRLTSEALANAIPNDFATMTHMCNCESVAAPGDRQCTAVTTLKFKDASTTNEQIPVDFVLLIDVSGSMEGNKLRSAQAALHRVSTFFNRGDRVSLVKFNDEAFQVTPLVPIGESADHLASFKTAVSNLRADGGTHIVSAMRAAFSILKDRTFKNPLCHVLLFTDGQDSTTLQDLYNMKSVSDECGSPSWSAFGFGSDHDASRLTEIATIGRGTFTFIEESMAYDMDAVFAAFVSDASNVAACDVVLTFEENDPISKLVKINGKRERSLVLGNVSVGAQMSYVCTFELACHPRHVGTRISPLKATLRCKGLDGATKTIEPVTLELSIGTQQTPASDTILNAMATVENALILTETTERVANVLEHGNRDEAVRIIDSAIHALRGDGSAQNPTIERLAVMRIDSANDELRTVQRRAQHAHASGVHQRAVFSSPYSQQTPSIVARTASDRARSQRLNQF